MGGKDEPTTKFFGNLLGGNDQNCGACGYSQGYNQGASNSNNQGQGFNHGSSNQAGRCQVIIARRSLTRMAGHTEGAEEPTSLGAPGATQLDGVTLVVEISSLPEGFPTTPGPTEPALTTDKNFINAEVVMMYRLKERIAK